MNKVGFEIPDRSSGREYTIAARVLYPRTDGLMLKLRVRASTRENCVKLCDHHHAGLDVIKSSSF